MRLKRILNEIGDGDTYPLKKIEDREDRGGFEIVYEFQTDNHTYHVSFEGSKLSSMRGGLDDGDRYEVEIKYTAEGYDFDELTGEGSPIRVINTVVEATKRVDREYWDVVDYYMLEGVVKDDEDPMEIDTTQRARIYKRFYERAFPDAIVEIQGNNVYVHT